MQIRANEIVLEYEEFGPKDGTPIVLIRGLGTQLAHWPQEFMQGFADRGYRTIIFDNRDVGLSQCCPAEDVPTTAEDILNVINAGGTPIPAYTVDHMARDVVGLLDSLGIDKAHILGISMGGMVAQLLAINHAERLISDTIVMTAAGLPNPALLPQLLAYPLTREDAQTAFVQEFQMWGSPGFPLSEEEIVKQAGRLWDRAHDPEGVNRQVLAIVSTPDRREALKSVKLPCLVIHGAADALIPPEAGMEIASLIPNAELEIVEGMGHIITPVLAPVLVEKVDDFIKRCAP